MAAMTDTAGAKFDRLLDIMRTLRAPGGCPWDREQTHASLRPFVLEETYEVLDAIETGNPATLREELGDFLYEAVFLAQISEEAGQFSMPSLRDRFAMAKSRSPISSSARAMLPVAPDSTSCRTSATSSSIFASTSSARCQSKPTVAARLLIS